MVTCFFKKITSLIPITRDLENRSEMGFTTWQKCLQSHSVGFDFERIFQFRNDSYDNPLQILGAKNKSKQLGTVLLD